MIKLSKSVFLLIKLTHNNKQKKYSSQALTQIYVRAQAEHILEISLPSEAAQLNVCAEAQNVISESVKMGQNETI